LEAQLDIKVWIYCRRSDEVQNCIFHMVLHKNMTVSNWMQTVTIKIRNTVESTNLSLEL